MPIPKNRARIANTAFLITVILGALAGYLAGRGEVLHDAGAGLVQDAERVVGLLGSLVIESQETLKAMNSAEYAPCSEQELGWFRQLVFHAVNLRDVGRMHEGRIQCSAVYGRVNPSGSQVQPTYRLLDGTSIYIDLPPYLVSGSPAYARQKGDAYVVEDPSFSIRFQALRGDHGFASNNVPKQSNGYPQGFTPRVPGIVADRDAQGRVGDTLYATRCSTRGLDCIVSYGSVSATLRGAAGLLALYSALGGLSGGCLVLAFLVLYRRNRSMEAQLRRAIREGNLTLVYQPIVELSSGRAVQAEALLRWTDEDGFAVSPLIFVKVAEELGFVSELTEFVVRRSLLEVGDLLRSAGEFQLSVNVTASDLGDAGFLPMLDRALAEAGVAAARLAIEVTESSTANTQVAIETIRRLRQRGHRVLIDDFGTGYSSLAYLKDLAVDTIKIDKSFTQATSTSAVIGVILPQILAMAEALELEVIVEGIETGEQAEFFAAQARPMLGQGWYFARPMPASDLPHGFAELEKQGARRLARV
jgi:sensor c-di-GMP phosphodiesterase-like protein